MNNLLTPLQRQDTGSSDSEVAPGDRSIFNALATQGRLAQAASLLGPESFRILSAEREREAAEAAKPPQLKPKSRARQSGKSRGSDHDTSGKTETLPPDTVPAPKKIATSTPTAPAKRIEKTAPFRSPIRKQPIARPVSLTPRPLVTTESSAPSSPAPRPEVQIGPAPVSPLAILAMGTEKTTSQAAPAFLLSLLAEPLPPLAERLCLDSRHSKLASLAGEFPGTANGHTKGLVEHLLAQAASACAARHNPSPVELTSIYRKLEGVLGSESPARLVFERFFKLLGSGELRNLP